MEKQKSVNSSKLTIDTKTYDKHEESIIKKNAIRQSLSNFVNDYSILPEVLPKYNLMHRYRRKGDKCYFESLSYKELDLLLDRIVYDKFIKKYY